MGGSTLTYLPDGQHVFPPAPPKVFYADGNRVTVTELNFDLGNVGFFQAQRPLFIGLGTTATPVRANGVWAAIGLQQELIDNYDGHSTTTNNAFYYYPLTGNTFNNFGGTTDVYLCVGYVPITGVPTTRSAIAGILRSGPSGLIRWEGEKSGSPVGHDITQMAIALVTGVGEDDTSSDFVEVQGYQTDTVDHNTDSGGKTPSLMVQWAGSGTSFGTTFPSATQHTWVPQDQVTADETGASPVSPGIKVPLDFEFSYNIYYQYSPAYTLLTSQGSSQTIPTGGGTTWTSIQFPTSLLDNFGGWSSGANTRYTCVVAGLYYVAGYASVVESSSTHAGYRACRLLVNGTAIHGGNTVTPVAGTDTLGTALFATDLIQLNVGDFVELQMQQTQGSALTVRTGTGDASRLIVTWQTVGP